MPWQSPYCSMNNTPVFYNDPKGDSVWLFSTTLPGADDNAVYNLATHTFLVVKTTDGVLHYFAYGPDDHNKPMGGSQLVQVEYSQDRNVYSVNNTKHLKEIILVPVPDGQTQEEFDQNIIDAANSFGNVEGIEYNAVCSVEWQGNCHTSCTTILYKGGVSKEELGNLEEQISGFSWGFEDIKPWTEDEMEAAVSLEKARAAKAEREAVKDMNNLTSPNNPRNTSLPNKW